MLVLLLVGTFLHQAPSDSVESPHEPALQDAMDALGRVLDYCEHNYRMLNLDAVIGVRMVDGECTEFTPD
ncbi:Hypp5030 [Branchiostoma lanceolatum]|uniref:Hypp5030 protein n=1 Tax=Branchiostoma lanceolatum TaxID=7740 RepID=A0A8K0AEK1_BRALA|nr:Hypp5030 [Branchiostoma lanceolatum]